MYDVQRILKCGCFISDITFNKNVFNTPLLLFCKDQPKRYIVIPDISYLYALVQRIGYNLVQSEERLPWVLALQDLFISDLFSE